MAIIEEYYIVEATLKYSTNYILAAAYYFLMKEEGFKEFASKNKVDGHIDIGYGFVWDFVPEVRGVNRISIPDAQRLLYKLVIEKYNNVISKSKEHTIGFTAGEKIACISLIYQNGFGNFANHMDSHMEKKNKKGMSREFANMDTVRGKGSIASIGSRRGREKTIFDADDKDLDRIIKKLITRR